MCFKSSNSHCRPPIADLLQMPRLDCGTMCTLTSESDIFRGLGGEVQFAVQAPGSESDPSHPSSGVTNNSISEWERSLGDLKI